MTYLKDCAAAGANCACAGTCKFAPVNHDFELAAEWKARAEELRVFAGTQTDECARLRAQQAATTAVLINEGLKVTRRADAAEARLATAVGLLGRCRLVVSPVSLLRRDMDAFLANQPAAPTRTEDAGPEPCMSPYRENYDHSAPTRTEAERIRLIANDRISWHTPERLDGILTVVLK